MKRIWPLLYATLLVLSVLSVLLVTLAPPPPPPHVLPPPSPGAVYRIVEVVRARNCSSELLKRVREGLGARNLVARQEETTSTFYVYAEVSPLCSMEVLFEHANYKDASRLSLSIVPVRGVVWREGMATPSILWESLSMDALWEELRDGLNSDCTSDSVSCCPGRDDSCRDEASPCMWDEHCKVAGDCCPDYDRVCFEVGAK